MTGKAARSVGSDRPPRRRLLFKYSAFVFLAAAVVLVASWLVASWVVWREQRRLIADAQVLRVRMASERIRNFLQDTEGRLRFLVTAPWLARDDEDRRIDAIRVLRDAPAVSELTLIDASGREVTTIARTASDRPGSNVDWRTSQEFLGARRQRAWYGQVFFVQESEPSVRLAVAGGEPSNVALATVNLKHIWDVITRIDMGRGGRAYVVDSQGRVIAHPDISLVLRNTSAKQWPQVAAALADGDDGAPRSTRDSHGVEVLATHMRLAPLDWFVIGETPLREAYAPLFESLWLMAGVGLGGLVLAGAASMWFARRMTDPIRHLQAGAEQIGAGAFDYRIPVRSDDELGDLATRFNAMAERLQGSYETLEARVRERTAQLAQANEDKTRFFAAANHDLRQPLNALGLFIARLRSDGDPVRRAQHMDRVEAALRNMNALFDALLDISKLDAGAVAARPEAFAMAPLLERLETTFSPLAEGKGLRLTVDTSAAWVNSDPVLVERILQNLISNAIRYTDAGSVRVDCETDGERLRIRVRDTGVGMTPQQQARAFDEFYRAGTGAHGRDAEWSAGLGLGLSIVDRLARLLGIDIDLQSTPGGGTTIGFALTLAAAAVTQHCALDAGLVSPRTAFGAGRRALVVDDDALALDAMLALMEDWGFETTAAENFAEAERIARGQTFDLVISDYHLGDGDGLAVIAAQRAHNPRGCAILASGDDDPAIAEKARAAAAPLFAKPVSPLSLRAYVASLFPSAAI